MNVSHILDRMGVQCMVRGDLEYSEDLIFENLPIEILDGSNVTNAQFHEEAATALTEFLTVEYGRKLQHVIDQKAQEKLYENGFACASYAQSSNQTWQSEAQQFIVWRDACWEYAQSIQSDVEAGNIPAPSLEEFLSNVPVLNWS